LVGQDPNTEAFSWEIIDDTTGADLESVYDDAIMKATS
jgi:hypothetical protein